MACTLLVKATRLIGAFSVLPLIGILAFSSSALLFRDRFRPLKPASKSQLWRKQNDRMKALRISTDLIDAGADSSVKTETSEIYSLGDKNDYDSIVNDNDNDAKHVLTFQSSFERQSNPFVLPSSNIKLDEFLRHTDHLLDAGKSVHSKIVPKTTELLEEWTVACDRVGACPPNSDHGVIMSVRTAGISIPGLSVEWSAVIGTNLIYRDQRHHNQDQYPELEFVLIKDESKVSSGAKPIVWIYNKLTQNRTKPHRIRSKRRSSTMDTKLFTRLGFYKERSSPTTCSSQDIDDRKDEAFVIRCTGTMEMRFRIPSMLAKLMFSSNGGDAQKSKAERQISNLITRQIEKDAEQNVLRWEENFRTWTQERN